ncbi:MAG: type II toxin-antitoxin system RelE/ParE family toxin, partial [Candidatus Angelobacter sp.]
MPPTDKPLVWLSGEIKSPPFSAASRLEAGVLLRRLQRGEHVAMPHSRPMPSIGPRCQELRIPDAQVSWRIVYRLDHDAVLILQVFRKTTRATPLAVITNCKRRLRAYD